MKGIIAWFVDNPVAANLLMLMFVLGGLLSLPNLKQEEFPSIETDNVTITIPYLGATPLEVEEAVCIRIEEALEGLPGIETLTSTASEGSCSATAELSPSANKSKLTDDIKNKIDTIATFPEETERPEVAQVTFTNSVVQLAITGNAQERTLKRIGEKVRDDLMAKPGISQITLSYTRPYEISIEVSEQTLRRYGLSMAKISDAIRQSSINLPAGSIKAESGEILVRTREQAYTGEEFENVVVLTRNDGTRLLLGDIAKVVDGFEESDMQARFNGQPTVMINVKQVGEEDIIAVAKTVKAYVKNMPSWLPAGISATIWDDESKDLIERLAALNGNALSGLILVLITLAIFLRLRLAFWVAAGMPIALLGTVSIFAPLDISLSTLSVISFIMVLGILVDDAIVVGERVYAHQQRGMSWRDAAISGTQEVSVPVIFGVLTSAATFLPLMTVPGHLGSFFAVIGAVVIISLFFSIVESQLILPAHLAHPNRRQFRFEQEGFWFDLQSRVSKSLEDFIELRFKPLLLTALRERYITLSIGIAVVLLTIAMMASGWITVQFFPSIAGNNIVAKLIMPEGTPIDVTARANAKIEAASAQLRAELDRDYPLENGASGSSNINFVFSSVGASTGRNSHGGISGSQSNQAEVALELIISDELPSSKIIANRWRELTGPIADAMELTFSATSFSAGDPVSIELRGRDVDQLQQAAAQVRLELGRYPGVFDIYDSFREGKQEIQLTLLPEAQNLGLTATDLARQVRQAFYGEEVQRIQRGQDDIRVMMRFPESQRQSISDLEQMRIRTAEGTEVPFASVAVMAFGRGYSTINREDGQRIVRVVADIDREVTTPEEVLSAIETEAIPAILAQYPSVTSNLGGEAEQRRGALDGLIKNFLMCMLLVYGLLAIPLKSYLQPLVIMSVIPFGVIGAILGHFLIGQPVVFFSMLGMVALSGVVVNSSLVLVDYVNRQRREGTDLMEAVQLASCVRFRPIMLTSITTFVGLLPLILSPSMEIKFFMPMAISLAFGILFATVITLLIVPSLYLILEDFRSWSSSEDKSLQPQELANQTDT